MHSPEAPPFSLEPLAEHQLALALPGEEAAPTGPRPPRPVVSVPLAAGPPPSEAQPQTAPVDAAPPAASATRRAADALAARGLPPEALATAALGLSVLPATCLALGHHGAAAVTALPALALAALARAEPEAGESGPFARAATLTYVGPLTELLAGFLAAGLVLDSAARGSPFGAFVRTGVLVLLLWLPLTRAADRTGILRAGGFLLGWGERLAVLTLGCLLGRPTTAAAVLLLVLAGEAWLRARVLWPGFSSAQLPPAPLRLLGATGTAPPAWRWGFVGASALLFLVLARESGWSW